MARYRVKGRSAATAATANHVGAAIWNLSTARSIKVVEIWYFKRVATADNVDLSRIISGRGTPGSTVTPDIDNDEQKLVAPASGFVLDLGAYSVQPTTVSTPPLGGTNLPATLGSGFIWVFSDGIIIPQSQGLALHVPASDSVILQPADVTFVVDD